MECLDRAQKASKTSFIIEKLTWSAFAKSTRSLAKKRWEKVALTVGAFDKSPTSFTAFFFNDMSKDFHIEDENIKRKQITLSNSSSRKDRVHITSVEKNKGGD